MNRFHTFTAGLMLAALPLPGVGGAVNSEWRFEVFLDDKPIGFHSFRLDHEGDARRLRSDARFRVSLLGLTLYDYAHRSEELWQDDCLLRIDASTDDNGRDLFVRGKHDGEQLQIENNSGTTGLDGCVMTFAYWNPAILTQQRLLNVQTGEYQAVSVQRLGATPVGLQNDPAPAFHYRISTGENDIELWYSADRDWLGLRSTTRGNRQLHYRRVPEAFPARSSDHE
ncbi:MAG: hypothetical protein J5I92_17025 [Thiogranum sp.]|nr:hypothetical protein [Thiogranum sp.]